MLADALTSQAVAAPLLMAAAADAATAVAPARIRAPAQEECGGLITGLGEGGEGGYDYCADGMAEAVLSSGAPARCRRARIRTASASILASSVLATASSASRCLSWRSRPDT